MDVLLDLVGELPRDLPASVFVVIHTVPSRENLIPQLLGKRGPLPASHPLHGEKFEPGHIYVAPSDNQLMLHPGTMEVVRGPRENGDVIRQILLHGNRLVQQDAPKAEKAEGNGR